VFEGELECETRRPLVTLGGDLRGHRLVFVAVHELLHNVVGRLDDIRTITEYAVTPLF
jgi:hypothetical protein